MAEMRTVFTFLITFLFTCRALSGSVPEPLFSFQKDINFIDDLIYSVAQDDRGYWWIGTSGGLVRFDGVNSHRILSRNGEPLSGLKVNRLLVNDDSLWLGMLSGGVAKLDLNNYQLKFYGNDSGVTKSKGLSGELIVDMNIDSYGTLWVGTERGLNRYSRDKDNFESFHINRDGGASLYSHGVRMAMKDSSGRVWVVSMKHGLLFLDESGGFQGAGDKLTMPASIERKINRPGYIRGVKETESGGVLLLLKDELIHFQFGESAPRSLMLSAEKYSGHAMGLVEGPNGNFWIRTTEGGVFKVSKNLKSVNYHDIITPTGQPKNGLQTDLSFSAKGDMAVAYLRSGLEFVNAAYLNNFTVINKSGSPKTSDKNRSAQETVTYYLVENGLALRNDNELRFMNDEGELQRTITIPMIENDISIAWGDVWLSTDDGVFRLDPHTGRQEKIGKGYFGFSHYFESEGLFLVGESGVYRLSGPDSALQPVKVDSEFEPITVTLKQSASGDVWLIQDGIPRYFDASKSAFIKPLAWELLDGLVSGNDAIVENGIYYNIGERVIRAELSRKKGVWKFENATVILEKSDFWDIAELKSSDTGLWFISQNGTRMGYLDYSNERLLFWGNRQGLPRRSGVKLVDVVQGSTLMLADGDYFYRLNVDVKKAYREEKLAVTGVRVGNINEETQSYQYKPSNLIIEPHEQSIHIEISDFRSRYYGEFYSRYRLLGQSDEWIETFNSVVSYSGLKHGSYRFQLQSLGENAKVEELLFEVRPTIWQSNLAFLLYFIFAAFVLFAFVYQVVSRARLKKDKESEINVYLKGFESIDQGICLVNKSGIVLSRNRAFDFLLDPLGVRQIDTITCIGDSSTNLEAILNGWDILLKVGRWSGKIEFNLGEKQIYLEIMGFEIAGDKNDQYMLLLTDISERIRNENQLKYLSLNDDLTGLPNRRHLLQELRSRIRDVKNSGGYFSVNFLDLDRFKNINDSFGHFFGDKCLQFLAIRLKNSLIEGEFIARLGGDEFVVVSAISQSPDATVLEDKLLKQVRDPLMVAGDKIYVSLSVGYVVCPDQAATSSALMKMADSAMYYSKEMGGNRATLYTLAMSEKPLKKVSLENELRMAVSNDQLEAHFQPKINMLTGQVCGFEALLRWRSNQRGLIYPGRFIEIAEETGIIAELGWQMLKLVCKQLNEWRDQGLALVPVAINVSAKQLMEEGFADVLNGCLLRHSIAANLIEIEITETAFAADLESVIQQLLILRDRGHVITIDDYGTGYASLSYISRLPVDCIKIDQSFIDRLDSDENKLNIVKNTVALASSLQLKIVAEGVDSLAVHRRLIELGCDMGQGFFYNPALEGGDERLLKIMSKKNVTVVSSKPVESGP